MAKPASGAKGQRGHESVGRYLKKTLHEFLAGGVLSRLVALGLGYLLVFEGSKFLRSIWPQVWEAAGSTTEQREFRLVSIGFWAVAFVTTWVSNLLFGILYVIKTPLFERYRIQKKWPWEGSDDAKAEWRRMLLKSCLIVIFNQLVIALPAAALNFRLQLQLGATASPEHLPGPWTILWQLLVFMVVEDTMFYWGHRFLHHRSIYKYIHKLHHQYHTPVSISAEYTHPVEFVIGNIIPFAAGPLLLGSHAITTYIWAVIRLYETAEGHSGFEFPWSPLTLIPFKGPASVHDFHHSENRGNFGSFFTYWDFLGGTRNAYIASLEKKEKLPASPTSKKAA